MNNENEKLKVVTPETVLKNWLSRIGRKGGKANTVAKVKASKANLLKARQARVEQAEREL